MKQQQGQSLRHFWARNLLGPILGSLGRSFEGCFGRGSGRLKLAKTPAAPKVVDFIVRNLRLDTFLGSESPWAHFGVSRGVI